MSSTPATWPRRAFLGGLAGLGLAAGTAVYGRYGEADWFQVHEVPIARERFPLRRGTRLLHLSDLHLGPDVPLAMIAEAIRLGLGQRPDLVLLTGDFVTGRLGPAEAYARELARLVAAAPTFACLGNHDGMPDANPARHETDGQAVAALLRQAGVRLLLNERVRLDVNGAPLEISGVGDLWAGQQAPARCLDRGQRLDGPARLLLNHNPDARAALMAYDWQLMLCGHTHGGQVGLPWLAGRIAPVRDKSHVEGLRDREGRLIHITRGVGNLHGARFLCRPQVSVLVVV